MKKFNWKDVAFLFVWALVVLAIVVMFTTGCSSPTEPDDCELFVNGERVAEWACEEDDDAS